MIKPRKLNKGDRIAIVSLSWGGLGDPATIHKYRIAKGRLEHDFGLEVTCMPHALSGSEFVAENPGLREHKTSLSKKMTAEQNKGSL